MNRTSIHSEALHPKILLFIYLTKPKIPSKDTSKLGAQCPFAQKRSSMEQKQRAESRGKQFYEVLNNRIEHVPILRSAYCALTVLT